jgi:hypothetical protein
MFANAVDAGKLGALAAGRSPARAAAALICWVARKCGVPSDAGGQQAVVLIARSPPKAAAYCIVCGFWASMVIPRGVARPASQGVSTVAAQVVMEAAADQGACPLRAAA